MLAGKVIMMEVYEQSGAFFVGANRFDILIRLVFCRTNILDGYLLKSLDLLPLGNTIEILPDRIHIHKCSGGTQICMFTKPGNAHAASAEDGDVVVLGTFVAECQQQRGALEAMEAAGVPLIRHPGGYIGPGSLTEIRGSVVTHKSPKARAEYIVAPVESVTDETVDLMMAFRNTTSEPLHRPYDVVVRATGWNHNTSVYGSSAEPALQSNGKFARMTHEYESVNVPGLYFAGSLCHGKDRGRAVGGVIKGFRHTAKALFNILEAKYESNPW
eukprot:SAG11_NODE_4916_length_1723_cov_0.892241_1_plen_271_part_10